MDKKQKHKEKRQNNPKGIIPMLAAKFGIHTKSVYYRLRTGHKETIDAYEALVKEQEGLKKNNIARYENLKASIPLKSPTNGGREND